MIRYACPYTYSLDATASVCVYHYYMDKHTSSMYALLVVYDVHIRVSQQSAGSDATTAAQYVWMCVSYHIHRYLST